MSSFEKYDETSRHYDATRVPVGSDFILDCLARQEKPLHDITLLDAGCGTGAYSQAIVGQVGQIEAIDLSQGMLNQASRKLEPEVAAGRIRFQQTSIAALPFEAASFDAIMINQVVHHLDDSPDDGFPLLRGVIGEFARVLRPGGALLFNHTAQAQLTHAFWYYRLASRAHEAMRRRFVPLDELRTILEEAGFINRDSFVPFDAVCQGEAYFDGRGPLSKAWRDGDSFWALVDDAELGAALEQIRELNDEGKIEDFVTESDSRRPAHGQITILFATRV